MKIGDKFLVNMLGSFQTPASVYMVMEYCPGGGIAYVLLLSFSHCVP